MQKNVSTRYKTELTGLRVKTTIKANMIDRNDSIPKSHCVIVYPNIFIF